MRRLIATIALVFFYPLAAMAGFDSWTVDVESDPFSGGQRVTVSISTSSRSGVVIFCDTAETGLTVRAVPGFTYEEGMEGFVPQMEFAVDGERIVAETGEVGAVGDNLAISEVKLLGAGASQFVDAFSDAKSQVAIKDGISDRPHLMSARGTTKSGKALLTCMERQAQ